MSRRTKLWAVLFAVAFIAAFLPNPWNVSVWAFYTGWLLNMYATAAGDRDYYRKELSTARKNQEHYYVLGKLAERRTHREGRNQ